MYDLIIQTGGSTVVLLRGVKFDIAVTMAQQHARTRKGVFITSKRERCSRCARPRSG